jgi:hypothetical protein
MSMPELIAALAKARSEFPAIIKRTENTFHHTKYATLAQALKDTESTLMANGLTVTQETDLADGVLILVTTLWHTGGATRTSRYPVVPAESKKVGDPQELGKSLTYARRYQFFLILGIASEDNDGNPKQERPTNRKERRAEVTQDDPVVKQFREAKSLDDIKTIWKGLNTNDQARYNGEKDAAKARLGGGPTRQALQGAT